MSSCKPPTSSPKTLPSVTDGECLTPPRPLLAAASYSPRLNALCPLPSAPSMACLLALKRYHDCLALITREVKQGRASADVYILRARLYNFFQKVMHSGRGKQVPGELHFLPPDPLCPKLIKEARPALHTVPKAPPPLHHSALTLVGS